VIAKPAERSRAAVRRALVMACALFVLTAPAWSSQGAPQVIDWTQRGPPLVAVDWQPPISLPPRFRNHCRYDPHRAGWYCANHCGPDYQFYYCSPASFGCCHPGYGYCDWQGHLRCAP
jgi:hypothetical protein